MEAWEKCSALLPFQTHPPQSGPRDTRNRHRFAARRPHRGRPSTRRGPAPSGRRRGERSGSPAEPEENSRGSAYRAQSPPPRADSPASRLPKRRPPPGSASRRDPAGSPFPQPPGPGREPRPVPQPGPGGKPRPPPHPPASLRTDHRARPPPKPFECAGPAPIGSCGARVRGGSPQRHRRGSKRGAIPAAEASPARSPAPRSRPGAPAFPCEALPSRQGGRRAGHPAPSAAPRMPGRARVYPPAAALTACPAEERRVSKSIKYPFVHPPPEI
ncbi:basic proline-rich protein-like [Falco peregrinus]|uniref:basic proline-rich protein-like n=1 Tax=Falco peregrinus TaxID=8954 RepID=UPI00247A1E7E|nr:basic proline-rich protein-like [Falco peregrinus]